MLRLLSLIIINVLLLAGPAHASGKTAVTFAIGEWAPYTGVNLPGKGMAAEIVSAACNAAGLQAQFEFLPWKRAESVVAAGTHFGTFPYRTTKTRLAIHWFSAPLFRTHFSIIGMKSNLRLQHLHFTRLEDLKGYSVGIVRGTDWAKTILEKAGVTVDEANGVEDNLRKLAVGRIDLYIDDNAVLRQALHDSHAAGLPDGFVLLDRPFSEDENLHIMVSRAFPDSTSLLARLNEGIERIRESGEYQKILTRYQR